MGNSGSGGSDAGNTNPDASNATDAGDTDASNPADGSATDAGDELDSSIGSDGGVSNDASAEVDAATDAASDSGSNVDAGSDAAVQCVAEATNLVDTSGTPWGGQSFNETRALEITPNVDATVSALVLNGLNASGPGLVGARIYNATTQALVASADTTVESGTDLQVEVSITANLAAGTTYSVGFYVNTGNASGNFLEPSSFPYTVGLFQVSGIGESGSDDYPSNMNIFAPRITIKACADGDAGTGSPATDASSDGSADDAGTGSPAIDASSDGSADAASADGG
jgi:hypothetical protein